MIYEDTLWMDIRTRLQFILGGTGEVIWIPMAREFFLRRGVILKASSDKYGHCSTWTALIFYIFGTAWWATWAILNGSIELRRRQTARWWSRRGWGTLQAVLISVRSDEQVSVRALEYHNNFNQFLGKLLKSTSDIVNATRKKVGRKGQPTD